MSMTIKKPMKAPASSAAAPTEATTPGPGGATIADRFKLDMPDPNAAKASASGPFTTAALIAGLVALGVSGILTYMLWQHWEFLMPA